MKTTDAMTQATERMLDHLHAIAEGESTPVWVKGWDGQRSPMPMNLTTGNEYHGINVWNLWLTQMAMGYATPRWFTFNQKNKLASELGEELKLRKGEKATPIFRLVEWVKKEAGSAGETERRGKTMRVFQVFNLDQLESIPESLEQPQEMGGTPDTKAFIEATGARIVHTEFDGAKYIPSCDQINMPLLRQFKSEQEYMATCLHELVHWTGHKDRLDRFTRHSKEDYSFEELVAELGSAMLCVEFGYEANINHVAYLHGYMKVLKADDQVFYRAAREAQKAVDYLHGQDN